MQIASRPFVVLGLAMLCGACLRRTEQPDLAGQDVRLTVLHTSDIHSRILPYFATPGLIDRGMGLCIELQPIGGAARMQYLLEKERARSDRVLYVDSGDCFQGAPIFNHFRGEVEVKVMSLMGPDGVVVGNHEFDLGAKNLEEQYQAFGHGLYPLLAANYIWPSPEDTLKHRLGALVKPYTIVNLNGLKVALIGMGNTSSMTSIKDGDNSLGITPLEPLEALRAYVHALQHQVDLVFVVSHMGLTSRAEPNLAEDTEVITGYERVVPRSSVLPCEYPDPADCWQELGSDDATGDVRVRIPGVRGIDAIFGGHLHIILNPPKVFKDSSGRNVLLVHSGAFAKFFGRLDVLVRVPKAGEDAPWGAEIVSHDYTVRPITGRVPKKDPASVAKCVVEGGMGLPTDEVEEGLDEIGLGTSCMQITGAAAQLEICKAADQCRIDKDACGDACRRARQDCLSVPAPIDGEMLELLDPYATELYQHEDLNRSFAFATERILRFGRSGEDSPLGNLVTDSMRKRNRVEAQFALTNSLGIRTNMEAGLVTIEQMFNIFPFENTLTTMYLSGVEVQELFDYVTQRSTERGCQTQAQISGATFVMNCAQQLKNLGAPKCSTREECPEGEFDQCRAGRCYKSPAEQILIQGRTVNPTESYKVAVNDFIGRGGSGFEVLRRNTTQVDTGLSLRDALIDYMKTPPALGGPGRLCGSPFLVKPPRPARPYVVFDKKITPEASCESKPAGCTEFSGTYVDCEENEDKVEFFCIPHDFDSSAARAPEAERGSCRHIEQVAEVAELFETLSFPAGTENACSTGLARRCDGQLHCCTDTKEDNSISALFYCMVPQCIEPPPIGRIKRIVQ